MEQNDVRWDFFIAHASADLQSAEDLFDHLSRDTRAFLASKSLRLGDDWDVELVRAQQEAHITVVLISDNTSRAFYQRDEIATAISLARDSATGHRVVPLFLGSATQKNEGIPYGLRVKHGLVVDQESAMDTAAMRLRDLLLEIGTSHGREPILDAGQSEGIDAVTDSVDPWAHHANRSIQRLERLAQSDRGVPPSLFWKLAVLLARAGRIEEALQALRVGDERCTEARPAERWLFGGFVSLRAANDPEAESCLRRFLSGSTPNDRSEAIGFDLLGQVLRRRGDLSGAEDAFECALRSKRKLNDGPGTGVTLGNLGRLLLYQNRPLPALRYFEENRSLVETSEDTKPLGIIQNNMAEALFLAGRSSEARRLLNEVLEPESAHTAVDRAFAAVLHAEVELYEKNTDQATVLISRARDHFEQSEFPEGVALTEEVEGLVATAKAWRLSACHRFRVFEAALEGLGDSLFSVFRHRRRAVFAAEFGDEDLLLQSINTAKRVAVSSRLPLLSEIETEYEALKDIIAGRQPQGFGTLAWSRYWRGRLPRPLALRFPRKQDDTLAWFKFAEKATEYLLVAVLADDPTYDFAALQSRLSFGSKVGSLREALHRRRRRSLEGSPDRDSIVRALEDLVESRNRFVHSDRSKGAADLEMQITPLMRFLADETRLHICLPGTDARLELHGQAGGVPAEGSVGVRFGEHIIALDEWFRVIDGQLIQRSIQEPDCWFNEFGETVDLARSEV